MRTRLRHAWIIVGRSFPHILKRGFTLGYCPICQRRTIFYRQGPWLRSQFRCIRCDSAPRWRALIVVLETFFPQWRDCQIHESSPDGAASRKIARECRQYCPTHWFPETPLGEVKNGFRCENLESQTFPDESFDLVVTQDVFEHVLEPAEGFREVARTLKPGGAHVFTIPWYYWQDTRVRAIRRDGKVQHLAEPDFHGNPIDPQGSLVVTEWGVDFCDFVFKESGLTTTVVHILDRKRGIDAEFNEIFISRKSSKKG